MQSSDMAGLYTAAADVLAPFSSAALTLRITSIYSDGNGHAYVHWSCGQGSLAPYAAKSLVTSTPTGTPLGDFIWVYNSFGGGYTRNGTNSTFIMTESQFVYTPPAQFVIRAPLTISHTSYLLPRQSSYVGFPWDGVSTDTPIAPVSATSSGSTTLSNGATCNYIY